jgi:hypothetical protein
MTTLASIKAARIQGVGAFFARIGSRTTVSINEGTAAANFVVARGHAQQETRDGVS